MDSTGRQDLDHEIGRHLGNLCSTLAALLTQGERAMGEWIGGPPCTEDELRVARESIHRAARAASQAREALAWVEAAFDTPPSAHRGDQSLSATSPVAT